MTLVFCGLALAIKKRGRVKCWPPLGKPTVATPLRLTLEVHVSGGHEHPEAAIGSWDTRQLSGNVSGIYSCHSYQQKEDLQIKMETSYRSLSTQWSLS